MINEDFQQKIKNLTIQNPLLFAKVLENNPTLCRQLLNEIFNLQIGELNYLDYDNAIKCFPDFKEIRTDIYVHEINTIRFFTIEMQNNPNDYFVKKMRYYRAIMDKDSFRRINNFADLYIVFICPFDVFQEGCHIYEIKNRCIEEPSLLMDDGCYQIFLCTESKKDDVNIEVKSFLDYVANGEIKTTFVQNLDDCVQKIKSDEKFQSNFKKYLLAESTL